jgi:phenylalanyl-tRNA synthetase alpha chain
MSFLGATFLLSEAKMEKEFLKIEKEALEAINLVADRASFNEVRNTYLSKKGVLSDLMSKMKTLSQEKRPLYGQLVNNLRSKINEALEVKNELLEAKELEEQLKKDKIDLTLPSMSKNSAGLNPFFVIKDEMEEIFISMGYEIADGPEIEEDHYNFELLNIPKDHPARDMQDSFYFSETMLLRTHTSPVQARVMQDKKGESIKIICPGKAYRRDNDDLTHSHQFAQVEGLVIDKNITLGNLKATLDLFVKKMFGEKRKTRFRASYFSFTEPSVEVDISCSECDGAGCLTCKGTGWIEILGAGMVNENVLRMNGYDPSIYQGFAFGIGIERVAMLRYGIDDIRRIYQNDIRFLEQFRAR